MLSAFSQNTKKATNSVWSAYTSTAKQRGKEKGVSRFFQPIELLTLIYHILPVRKCWLCLEENWIILILSLRLTFPFTLQSICGLSGLPNFNAFFHDLALVSFKNFSYFFTNLWQYSVLFSEIHLQTSLL